MTDIKLERESDAPADWKTDMVLERNADGVVIEADVPADDVYPEVNDDAGDD